jgi:hypothetical protein
MSISSEKGVRLHFPVESTTPAYRDMFWHNFAKFVDEFRDAFNKTTPDPPEDRQGLGHWEFMKKCIAEEENKTPDSQFQVGGIVFGL